MKGFLFAILLFISSFAFGQQGGVYIEAPQYCAPQLQATSYILQQYDLHKLTRQEQHEIVDEFEAEPNHNPEGIKFARELIDLVYAVQPVAQDEFIAIYELVIDRCVFEEGQRERERNELRL